MSSLPTRPLGHSGLQTTVIGLGCNNFGGRIDLDATRAVVDAALDAGITFFDTADIYGRSGGTPGAGTGRSEELLGEVLKGRRDEVLLATKFGMDMHDGYGEARGSTDYITKAFEASLRRLQVDSVDLYWYHRPDGVTPILETLTTLHDLVTTGKVRALGASNFSAQQLREAVGVATEHGLTPFTALQNEYSLLERNPENDGTLAACEDLGIGFIPFFPLASGLLTGKYSRSGDNPAGARLSDRDSLASDAQWTAIEQLQAYADEHRYTLTEMAIGTLLARPMVSSVIAGATKPEQIAANAAAADWDPATGDLSAIWEIVAAV